MGMKREGDRAGKRMERKERKIEGGVTCDIATTSACSKEMA